MRLIDTTTLELKQFYEKEIQPYAILSHRWEGEEITFQEFITPDENTKSKSGYRKTVRFCERAAQDDYKYAWIDTCCINKDSSAELSEAINSMFQWYQSAGVCYAYLSDVSPGSVQQQFGNSEWFKRGWTLQELIAPRKMLFLANDWTSIAKKDELAPVIQKITGIDKSILRGIVQINEMSIAKRMSWASQRKTTRIEDMAYCLMGVFDVNMPLIYGEGKKAFIRLQEEIMKDSDDQSLFAWEVGESERISKNRPSGLLARSPVDFRKSANIIPCKISDKGEPYEVTKKGIRLYIPNLGDLLILECLDTSQGFQNLVGVGISQTRNDKFVQWERTSSHLTRDIASAGLGSRSWTTIYVAKLHTRKLDFDQWKTELMAYEHSIYGHADDYTKSLRSLAPNKGSESGSCSKRLVLCFDTNNILGRGGRSNGQKHQRSTIQRIHQASKNSNDPKLCYYSQINEETVSHIQQRVTEGYKWLMAQHNGKDKIFIFGSSVGACVALELAAMLENIGLVTGEYPSPESAYTTYLNWRCRANKAESEKEKLELWNGRVLYWEMKDFRESHCRPTGAVEFLGLFDTATTTTPGLFPSAMSSIKAKVICHAVSIDEPVSSRRALLIQTPWAQSLTQRTHQVWFPGSHADIGGFAPVKEPNSPGLSLVPLVWMMRQAIKSGLQIERNELIREFGLQNHDHEMPDDIFSSQKLTELLHFASTQPDELSPRNRPTPPPPPATQKSTRSSTRWSFNRPPRPSPSAETEDTVNKTWRNVPPGAAIHISAIHRILAIYYRPKSLFLNLPVSKPDFDLDLRMNRWKVISETKGDDIEECYSYKPYM